MNAKSMPVLNIPFNDIATSLHTYQQITYTLRCKYALLSHNADLYCDFENCNLYTSIPKNTHYHMKIDTSEFTIITPLPYSACAYTQIYVCAKDKTKPIRFKIMLTDGKIREKIQTTKYNFSYFKICYGMLMETYDIRDHMYNFLPTLHYEAINPIEWNFSDIREGEGEMEFIREGEGEE